GQGGVAAFLGPAGKGGVALAVAGGSHHPESECTVSHGESFRRFGSGYDRAGRREIGRATLIASRNTNPPNRVTGSNTSRAGTSRLMIDTAPATAMVSPKIVNQRGTRRRISDGTATPASSRDVPSANPTPPNPNDSVDIARTSAASPRLADSAEPQASSPLNSNDPAATTPPTSAMAGGAAAGPIARRQWRGRGVAAACPGRRARCRTVARRGGLPRPPSSARRRRGPAWAAVARRVGETDDVPVVRTRLERWDVRCCFRCS